MEMYNPSHPGKILKEVYLSDYNLSISAFALRIGVSRNTASEILNCHSGISSEMALRLEKLIVFREFPNSLTVLVNPVISVVASLAPSIIGEKHLSAISPTSEKFFFRSSAIFVNPS